LYGGGAVPGRNEAKTRIELIDSALAAAGWDVTNKEQVGIEIPVDGHMTANEWQSAMRRLRERGPVWQANTPRGISDYLLYHPNGEVLAVVEAKKTTIQPQLAKTQTAFYVEEIARHQSFRPFAFMTNGHEIRFWDVGRENDRLVHRFFTFDDLERLKAIRERQKPLENIAINPTITDRIYQQEAVRRVIEAFEEKKKRRALLVMATGTGKTRTAMSLIDVFMRSNQARNILFVADRRELVKQALEDGFQAFFPDEPIDRIYTHNIDETKRLFAVSLQTLVNCFDRFSPAFFDLIIVDEVHRSIFNKYRKPLEYFDGRLVGLTATPASFIERNTFLMFNCDNETPTFLYSYEEAVAEKYLVNFELYKANTRFQRMGIRGIELSEEEQNALKEQGLEPDEINFEGTDLETRVSNTDTIRQQWAEFMDVCHRDESGQLPAKTIVFALTQDHAGRLADVFKEMYPQFVDLVEVVTHKSHYKGRLITKFKKEEMPRIAISVDMLDTGVDIPEVMNLVFMKPVHSYIKLWQMIGRGTRNQEAVKFPHRLPNGKKEEFLIIDFWENEFNKDPQEEKENTAVPVLVTVFNTRLKLLEALDRHSAAYTQTAADLRQMIAHIPQDSFTVKKVWPKIEAVWGDQFWLYMTRDKIDRLRYDVGPLMREVAGVDVQAATFTSKVERLKWQRATGRDGDKTAESIAEDAARLSDHVLPRPEQRAARDFAVSAALLHATPEQLTDLINQLAGQMNKREQRERAFLTIDLKDIMERRSYVFLYDQQRPVYVDEYQERVSSRVLELAANHPTIAAIENGRPVSDEQLLDLERTLRHELGSEEYQLTESKIRLAYHLKVDSFMAFVRELLEIEGIPDYADLVDRQFKAFAERQQFNAGQLRFLRAVQSVFLERRRLESADLYDAPPIRAFGMDAVEQFFDYGQQ
jgi:type I restriction enzyme R subunit